MDETTYPEPGQLVELGVMPEHRCYPTHHDYTESAVTLRGMPVLFCRLCGAVSAPSEVDSPDEQA